MTPDRHPSEALRLEALASYDLLDTPRERDFDEVVEFLAAICDAPAATITLVDAERQWFKAEVGAGVRETPRDMSICAHAILQPGLFIVPDTLEDARFRDNPLVTDPPHVRFYAGALLETAEGLPLGTVCVLDFRPRDLDEKQKMAIRLMARQVMRQIELRRMLAAEIAARSGAEAMASQNAVLAREVDHRVKNSLQLVSSMLSLQGRRSTSDEVKAQLSEAESRVRAIGAVHQQLYQAGQMNVIPIAGFLKALCGEIAENRPPHIDAVSCTAEPTMLPSDQAVTLGLMVNELVANAFKHAFPDGRRGNVVVEGVRRDGNYCLTVRDDGIGVAPDFDLASGDGLGMRILQALATRLGGSVDIANRPGGAEFQVCFAAGG